MHSSAHLDKLPTPFSLKGHPITLHTISLRKLKDSKENFNTLLSLHLPVLSHLCPPSLSCLASYCWLNCPYYVRPILPRLHQISSLFIQRLCPSDGFSLPLCIIQFSPCTVAPRAYKYAFISPTLKIENEQLQAPSFPAILSSLFLLIAKSLKEMSVFLETSFCLLILKKLF